MKITKTKAFTLIEVIVTLAVIAAIATAVLIPFIKHLDRLASEKEARTLQSLAEGYKKRIVATKVIPNQAGWAQAVATQLGVDVNSVLKTDRGQSRIFLIDPNLMVGANMSYVLPYTQPVTGSTITNVSGLVIAPASPRLMIVSSISSPLPAGLTSGVADATGDNAFTNIWETAEGAVPAGWTFGKAEDLKIQRMDLSDLFVQVVLNNRDTNLVPRFAIDDTGTNTVPYGSMMMYLLKGTELRLLNHLLALEYSEVLHTSAGFMFELGTWQGEVFLGRGVGQPGPLDLQRAMNLFLNAPANGTANGGASQMGVYDALIRYMSNFVVWRESGYPTINSSSEMFKSQADLSTITINMIDPR